MAKVMIITVGTGRNREDIAGAIKLSIQRENPDHIYFLTSPQSERETMPYVDNPFLKNRKIAIQTLDETNDVEEIYLKYLELIRTIIADGNSRENIVIDYTSGTKSMSAALFAAGVSLEVGSINYIAGKRDSSGRVIPGKERPIPIKPVTIFAENKINEARTLFNRYQFQSALTLLRPLTETLKENSIADRVELYIKLAEAYSAWDTFKLTEAVLLFGKINSTGLLKEYPYKEAFQKNFELVNQSKTNKYSIHRLVDLLNNIYRRMEEGKFDDAQARIYRLFEYMAQIKLYQEHNKIATERVKINELPSALKPKYLQMAGEKTELQLSMVKAFELLADLNDELGCEFIGEYLQNNSNLMCLLNKRNKSILAHGFTAIDCRDCEELLKITEEYMNRYFPEWINEKAKAAFIKI